MLISLSDQVIKWLGKFNLDSCKTIHIWKPNPGFMYKTRGSEWTANTKEQKR